MKECKITDYVNYKILEDGTILSSWKPKTGITWGRWTPLKHTYDKSCGYYIVCLTKGKMDRQNKRVHRLLAQAFLPNPSALPHVNHKDGDKLNNRLSNLEWCSEAHNAQHAVDAGLSEPAYVATRKSVIQQDMVGGYIATHVSIHEAGRATEVAWQNISKVVRGVRKSAGGFTWQYENV